MLPTDLAMAPLSLLLLPLLSVTTHAQSSRIQDLVTKLRSAPGHQSHSPSYTSQRKFEAIGSGELPLQSSGPAIAEEKETEDKSGMRRQSPLTKIPLWPPSGSFSNGSHPLSRG